MHGPPCIFFTFLGDIGPFDISSHPYHIKLYNIIKHERNLTKIPWVIARTIEYHQTPRRNNDLTIVNCKRLLSIFLPDAY